MRPISFNFHRVLTFHLDVIELPYTATRAPDASVFDSPHRNTTRKLGEAPLLFEPLPTHAERELAAVAPSVEVKNRAWGFGKHKDGPASIAAN